MGRSHFFELKRRPSDKRWAAFCTEAREILSHPLVAPLVCFEANESDRLPEVSDEAVQFNGRGEYGHETFFLARDPEAEDGFSWCKVEGPGHPGDVPGAWGKTYEIAVCAVLLAANHHLKLPVSSEADWSDDCWVRARVLLGKVTGRLAVSPWKEKQCAGCKRTFEVRSHQWGGGEICATKGCGCGSYTCCDGRTKVCMGCKGTRRKSRVSKSLCWFCSNGYASEQAADADLWEKINKVFAELEAKREEVRL